MASSWVLGVSGASGAIFARRFLHAMARHPRVDTVHMVVSLGARRMIREETDLDLDDHGAFPLREFAGADLPPGKVVLHERDAVEAPISSGSHPVEGMVVLPCSMATVGCIAHGTGRNLLHRAAEVQLKERRPLILCFREAPLSLVHVENLHAAARAGAILMPLAPPWYLRPVTVEDAADGFAARLLHTMALDHPEGDRYRYRP